MKNNPVQDKSPVHGDDYVVLPEPRTAVNICSKDILNVTVSKSSLSVFHNLAKVTPHPPNLRLPAARPRPSPCVLSSASRRSRRAPAPTTTAL